MGVGPQGMQYPISVAKATSRGAASMQTVGLVVLTLAAVVISALIGALLVSELGAFTFLVLPLLVVFAAVMARPFVGVLLLVVIIPLENLVVLGDAGTFVKMLGMVVFAAWLLHKVITRGSWASVLNARIFKPALLFVVLAFASLLWAARFDLAIGPIFTAAQLLVFSLLVADVVDSWRRLEWLVRFLVLGGLIALFMTLVESFSFTQSFQRAGDDISGGVGVTARYLVLLIPFAFVLVRAGKARLWRFIGLTFIALTPWTVATTLARTSFIFLPAVLGSQLWVMFKGRHRGRFLVLFIGLGLAVVIAAFIPWSKVLDRASTIGPAVQGVPGPEGKSESARLHHWIGAMLVFRDHPLGGVGYWNFGHHFYSYQYLVPERYAAKYYTAHPRAVPRSPHSSFLGILADLGVAGGVLWIWLLVVALSNARKSWTSSRRTGDRSSEILAQALFFSLLAYSLYGLVALVHVDKLFWLLLGVTEVLRRLTTSREESADASSYVPISAPAKAK